MLISIINRSTTLHQDELIKAIRAINRQLSEDFEPYWSFGGRLRLEGKVSQINGGLRAADMRGDAVLYIVDRAEQGDDALGYHDLHFSGIPYGFVFLELCAQLNEPWTVTLSHEALELIADPEANLLVKGPHPTERTREVYHWFEMCDAVQGDTYVVDGVAVSNFVLPHYFTASEEPGARNEFLGSQEAGGLRSFSVRPGGYIGFFDPLKNDDDFYFADARAQRRRDLKAAMGVGRSAFRKGAAAGEKRSAFIRQKLRGVKAAAPAARDKALEPQFESVNADPIKHVVLLMLENRSFDQMLGHLATINAKIDGFIPGRFNLDKDGKKVEVNTEATTVFPAQMDPMHDVADVAAQITPDGTNKMGGFVRNFIKSNEAKHSKAELADGAKQVMAYFPVGQSPAKDTLPVLHTLARNFLVCDHWHASVPGPTWTNRFFALTGTSHGWVEMPTTEHPGPLFHNYNQDTIFDRLDSVNRNWKIYHDGVPQSLVLARLSGRWDHFAPMSCFARDAARRESDFPDFTFIEPRHFGAGENSQHPPSDVMAGERLVRDVYNAIRSNDALWKSTLLVVVYDEHGGFYDHVEPPATVPPDNYHSEYSFDQLGVRVPALLISPWVARDVCNDIFDHTSLLRYLCEKWKMEPLGRRMTAEAGSMRSNTFDSWLTKLDAPREDTPAALNVPHTRTTDTSIAVNLVVNARVLEGARGALVLFAERSLPDAQRDQSSNLPTLESVPEPTGARAPAKARSKATAKNASPSERAAAAEAKVLSLLQSTRATWAAPANVPSADSAEKKTVTKSAKSASKKATKKAAKKVTKKATR